MLEDISNGLQTPDASPAHKLAQYAKVPDQARSDDASSDSEPEANVPVVPARVQLPDDAANFTWKIHAISGIVHALSPEMDKLACGRPLSCNYSTVPANALDRVNTCFCVQCGKSSLLQDLPES